MPLLLSARGHEHSSIVPQGVVQELCSPAGRTAASFCHVGEAGGGIVTHGTDGFQRQVPGALGGPFVGLLQQNGAYQAGDGALIRKNADYLGAAFDLAVEALDGVGALELGAVLAR